MLLKATEFLKLIEERKTSQLWQNLVKKWTDTYEYICPLLAEPARHASFRSDERMGTAWLGWDEGCIEVYAPTARTYVNEDNTIKYHSYGTDEEVINAEIEKVLSELEMGVREDTFVQICIDRNTAGMDLTLSKKNFFYTDFRMSVLKFDSVNPHFSNPYLPDGFEIITNEWYRRIIKDPKHNIYYTWIPLISNNWVNDGRSEDEKNFIQSIKENGGFYISSISQRRKYYESEFAKRIGDIPSAKESMNRVAELYQVNGYKIRLAGLATYKVMCKWIEESGERSSTWLKKGSKELATYESFNLCKHLAENQRNEAEEYLKDVNASVCGLAFYLNDYEVIDEWKQRSDWSGQYLAGLTVRPEYGIMDTFEWRHIKNISLEYALDWNESTPIIAYRYRLILF